MVRFKFTQRISSQGSFCGRRKSACLENPKPSIYMTNNNEKCVKTVIL